jgi:hypothetical protein
MEKYIDFCKNFFNDDYFMTGGAYKESVPFSDLFPILDNYKNIKLLLSCYFLKDDSKIGYVYKIPDNFLLPKKNPSNYNLTNIEKWYNIHNPEYRSINSIDTDINPLYIDEYIVPVANMTVYVCFLLLIRRFKRLDENDVEGRQLFKYRLSYVKPTSKQRIEILSDNKPYYVRYYDNDYNDDYNPNLENLVPEKRDLCEKFLDNLNKFLNIQPNNKSYYNSDIDFGIRYKNVITLLIIFNQIMREDNEHDIEFHRLNGNSVLKFLELYIENYFLTPFLIYPTFTILMPKKIILLSKVPVIQVFIYTDRKILHGRFRDLNYSFWHDINFHSRLSHTKEFNRTVALNSDKHGIINDNITYDNIEYKRIMTLKQNLINYLFEHYNLYKTEQDTMSKCVEHLLFMIIHEFGHEKYLFTFYNNEIITLMENLYDNCNKELVINICSAYKEHIYDKPEFNCHSIRQLNQENVNHIVGWYHEIHEMLKSGQPHLLKYVFLLEYSYVEIVDNLKQAIQTYLASFNNKYYKKYLKYKKKYINSKNII